MSKIAEVGIADLKFDRDNARRHPERNREVLEKSLKELGAARSIVIDEDGVVLAGNATVEAATKVGLEKVQVIDADGETVIAVRRRGLTPEQKRRLALYDNRTGELAEWDVEALGRLSSQDGQVLDGLWEENEIAALLKGLTAPGEEEWLEAFGKTLLRGEGLKYFTFVLSPEDYEFVWAAMERFGAKKKLDGEVPRHILSTALVALVREWETLSSGQ